MIPLVVASERGTAQTYTVLQFVLIGLRINIGELFKGQAVAV